MGGNATDGGGPGCSTLDAVLARPLVNRLTDPVRTPPQLAAAVASVRASVRLRHPARVELRDGYWVHRSRGAVLVTRSYWSPGPDELDAMVADEIFFGDPPEPGGVAIDVGAGVGEITRTLARALGPDGHVIAIEAHPATRGALELMLELNEIRHVEVVAAAVAAASGKVSISDGEHWEANALAPGGGGVEVPAITLDELVLDRRIERIDLLKMNIEGAEVEALRGMARTLERCRRVVVECHDFLAREPDDPMRTAAPVRAILEDHGFAVITRPDHPREAIRSTLYGFSGT